MAIANGLDTDDPVLAPCCGDRPLIGPDHEQDDDTTADLDALVKRMASEFAAQDGPVPPVAELFRPDPWAEGGVVIRLGIGADRGFIAHADADGSCTTTNGREPDGKPVIYDYQGHVREFPTDAEIPLDQVVNAVHDLVAADGKRPSTLISSCQPKPARTWLPGARISGGYNQAVSSASHAVTGGCARPSRTPRANLHRRPLPRRDTSTPPQYPEDRITADPDRV
ncbi:Imm1 family immunity protein [Saccharothrix xinjiangensis]|uniref:Imm1 family immunity protein n=1 Tax=Saccharothrix xinjiangensis TaxID=204798 RepID=A0ABV9Y4Q1_9PSEU